MLTMAHPEAKIAALGSHFAPFFIFIYLFINTSLLTYLIDLSKASLGYGMQRMKALSLDGNVKYYQGDLELLGDTPPAPFESGFDVITGILLIIMGQSILVELMK